MRYDYLKYSLAIFLLLNYNIAVANASGPCLEGVYTVTGTAAPTTTIEVVRSGGRVIMRGGWGAFNEMLHDSRIDGSSFVVKNENAFGSTVYSGTCSGGLISGKFENSRGFVGAMSGQLVAAQPAAPTNILSQSKNQRGSNSESVAPVSYGDIYMKKGRKALSQNTVQAKRLAANQFRGAAEFYAQASDPDRQREAVAAADAADAEADQLEKFRRKAAHEDKRAKLCAQNKLYLDTLYESGRKIKRETRDLLTRNCNFSQ